MNKDFYQLFKSVKNTWCIDCDGECRNCQVKEILERITDLDAKQSGEVDQEGCFVCQDKKGKNKDVFYFDSANNMRDSIYCPNCGRKISA